MKKYRAIIYDLDGTLLNTFDMNMYPLIQIIKEELNEDWKIEDVSKFYAYTGMKVLDELKIKNKEETYKRWVKYVNEYEDGAILYEGVDEVLKILNQYFLQAIVSSKQKDQYQIDVVSKGIDQYMKVVILEEDTIQHKPDPEPLLTCINRLGIACEEALYIGDTYFDYLASKNAGIDFGYAKWGSVSDVGIDEPTFVFEKPQDLLNLIVNIKKI